VRNNFNDCLTRVLKDEGGYTNDPRDPGGPTNFGITLKDYRLYVNPLGTAENVRTMNINDAKRIYKGKYWDALDCDSLSSGVDYTVFDYGVNSGLGRPRKALERFKSLKGIQLIDAINNERMSFLRALHTFPVFGKGWTRRVEGVRTYSKVLANKNSGPMVGGALGGASIGFSQYFHQHQAPILIGGLLLAVAVGVAIHLYKTKVTNV
jgi:lysozyme family protein